jgi:hypothetical protein
MQRDSASLLAAGDIDGLLDLHRTIFGPLRMDGEGGGDGAGDGGAGDGGGSGSSGTFTQADIDRIVTNRLNQQRAQLSKQYEGFDDLKTKAAEFDKLTEAQKTEAQKAADRAEAAEKAAATATQRAVRAEVKAIATGEFADPNDAHLYLGDLSKFIGKDGEIDSSAIEAALKEVEKTKPHLVARVRTDAGLGPRGGGAAQSPHQVMNQNIRQAAGR